MSVYIFDVFLGEGHRDGIPVLVAVVLELDLVANHIREVFFSLLGCGGSQT